MRYSNLFWGKVLGPSKDKGPYKLLRMRADGHEFNAKVLESYGFHSSPMTDGESLIALPDGDMGKATIIGGLPPKDRVDGLKEGETGLKNHKHGQMISLNDNGDIVIKSPSGIVHINPPE